MNNIYIYNIIYNIFNKLNTYNIHTIYIYNICIYDNIYIL